MSQTQKAVADFTFVTSNEHKVITARTVCGQFGLAFDWRKMDLEEIQAESGEPIAEHKVRQAFETCQSPVVVTDDNWSIPGLKGFPGPYMRYINKWLAPEDFLNLTRGLKDRRIIMKHIIAYKDERAEKVFLAEIEGVLLPEARGESIIPHFTVISFDGGQHSVAEVENEDYTALSELPNAWHQLGEWLRR